MSLLLIVCLVEDFLRIQAPVFEGSFNQARHDHKHQDHNINTGEHFIDHSGLLRPKRQQSCRTNTTYSLVAFLNIHKLRYFCITWLSVAYLSVWGWWAQQTCQDTLLTLQGHLYACVTCRNSLYACQWAHQRSHSRPVRHWTFLREGTL